MSNNTLKKDKKQNKKSDKIFDNQKNNNDIENENQDEIDENEDEDNDENNENNEDNDEIIENEEVKAEKKTKKIFNEIFNEISVILEEIKLVSTDIKIKEKEKIELEKRKNDLDKHLNKLFVQLPKLHSDDINKAKKEKKIRSPSENGILKLSPVPPVLIKFLGLGENELLQRPKVMSLLNEKFKALGLKQGQTTILDKKTAKIFGLNEGHEIKFTEFQTFLKNIYDNVPKNEVVL
jgi:hypothetical protein